MRLAVPLAIALAPLVGVPSPRPARPPQAVPGDAGPSETVSLEFLALAQDGRPILDLAREEITLKIGGRDREVRSLRLVQAPAPAEATGASGPETDPLPPPFETNVAASGGRTIIIVFEDESFRAGEERRAKDAIDRFLSALGPRDQVALVTMPYGGVAVDSTTDHARVRTGLDRMAGRSPRQQTASDLACRSRRTLLALTGLLEGLAGNEHPTTVVLVSTGLMGPTRDAPVTAAPGQCEITPEIFRDAGAAAAAGRALFYVVQSDEVMLAPDSADAGFTLENMRVGLEHLAGVTGGRLLRVTGGAQSGLSSVVRETSAHYVLAFAPQAAERSGTIQRVEVRVARPDVAVRARPTLVIPKPAARGGRPPAPRSLLREARMHRDLPLRAVGYVSKNIEDDDLRIIVAFESPDEEAAIAAAAAGLFDARGRLVTQWTAQKADLARAPALAAIVVGEGTYRLRVAAVDEAGRAGTVDCDLEARLTEAGPLKLSGLVLGVSQGRLVPRVQFGDERVAIAYLEIFGLAPAATAAVTFELASTLNGPALLSVPGALTPTVDGDRRAATAQLPIGAQPAGDFVVRAVVGAEGRPAGRVVRTLRKAPPRR